MKRTAAIIGPTPPFIRWALQAACPLVRCSGPAKGKRHPAQIAWRQLRGIKEVSQALAEGRSHAGYCFAPQSTSEQVLAVSIDEVTAPLGGTTRVIQACRACPANPAAALGRWAACTGLFPLVSPGETVEQTKAAWARRLAAIEQRAVVAASQTNLDPVWFHCWRGPSLSSDGITSARGLLLQVRDLFTEQSAELAELLAALELAERSQLQIWIEPVPAGWSDGQTWRLPAHCTRCGAEWLEKTGGVPCSACRSPGSYAAPRRLKVLGLRPYLQLSQVLGEPAARQRQLDYESVRVPADRRRQG